MPMPSAENEIKRYEEAKSIRAPYESDMRMAAAYCMPRQFSAWNMAGAGSGIQQAPTMASRLVYDSTGMRSLPKYVSIINRIMTPEGQRWSRLKASDPVLNKQRRVQEYFDDLNQRLFQKRYEPRAGFTQATGEVYQSIGVYGMGPKSVTKRRPKGNDRGGFAYKAWPMHSIFVLADEDGIIDTVFRRYYLNARNFKSKFGDAVAPKSVAAELAKPTPSETTMFEFVQVVTPRDDYDPETLDARRHSYRSTNICVADKEYVGDESGFMSLPILTPRVFTEPGELYGLSPALQALPALGGVSVQKKTLLKQGHRAVSPPLLATDDGALSGRVDMRPDAVNYGAVDGNGRAKIIPFNSGTNFNVSEALIEDEREDIRDAFFVTLFQILNESPEMTATEVVERVAEKASLLAPTMGRLQTEHLSPNISREIEILAEDGLIGDMPPELVEARGEYEMVHTSPLAKGMNAEDVSGFLRWQEALGNHAALTQTPDALDWLDIDAAAPEVADFLSVPTRWVMSADKVAAKREARNSQAQDQQLMDQAPALASVAKAAMDKGMG